MSTQNNFLMITSADGESHKDYPAGDEVARCNIKRSDFPEDFVFGAATSAYQIEGGWNAGNKGMSNWDVFTRNKPGGIADGSNGCVAIDHYNRFRDDVKLMKKLGLKSYRFSIAWSRILPGGNLCNGTSKEGIKYYNDLIDALVAEGIDPCVTLFHWDVPQCLEDQYQGFRSEKIVNDFCDFAELCFWEFGDRVKMWITLNEPWSFTVQGYVTGHCPPNRGSAPTTRRELLIKPLLFRSVPHVQAPLIEGNPGTEPYIVAHNLILCHAYAVDIYRKKYQESQGGKIGMTNCCVFYEPLTSTPDDQQAAIRALDFNLGWFVEPLVTGDYPQSMINYVGDRLPKFTPKEEKLVLGSYDFLGINNYTTQYAANDTSTHKTVSYLHDIHAVFSTERNGKPIGEPAGSSWLYIVPWGIYKLMMFIKNTYKDPVIYITENGVDELNQKDKNIKDFLSDEIRIRYFQDYLYNVKKAMAQGANVKGYYLWSLFDNFEWLEGYTVRFGIFYVDYANGDFTRLPKSSAIWWRNFLSQKPAIPLKIQAEQTDERRKRIRGN